MIAEIAAGLESLKIARDTVMGVKAFADEASANMMKVELSRHILDAQAGLLAAQQQLMEANQRVVEMKEELVRLKRWEEDSALYELADAGQGTLAYRKRYPQGGEPRPWLCPNCFERREKAILQPRVASYSKMLHCPRCGADFNVKGVHRPTSSVVRS